MVSQCCRRVSRIALKKLGYPTAHGQGHGMSEETDGLRPHETGERLFDGAEKTVHEQEVLASV